MIFERMNAVNVFHKVRQLQALSGSSHFARTCRLPQFDRTPTSFANINRCLTSTAGSKANSSLLTKFPITSSLNAGQIRATSTQGDHVRLWVFEKVISASLPVLMPAALLLENPVVDGLLALFVVMHTHWGLEAIIVDYARPSVIGRVLPKIIHLGLNILSAVTLAGLLVLIYNGPGIAKVIKNAWAIGKEERKDDE